MRTQFSEAEPTVLKVQFIASFHDRKVISQAACAKDDDRVAPRDLPVVPHLAFDVGRHMYCDPQSTEMIRQASMSVFCLRDTEVGIETLPAACEVVPPSRVGPLDAAANHRPWSVLPGSLMCGTAPLEMCSIAYQGNGVLQSTRHAVESSCRLGGMPRRLRRWPHKIRLF